MNTGSTNQRCLTTRQAADYLGVSKSYLDHARSAGTGPTFIKIGERSIRYTREDLDAYIDQCDRFQNTAEAAA